MFSAESSSSLWPRTRLGCERFEDRINPAGWLDDYAAWFDRNIGGNWYNNTIGAATDWALHAVGFTDETLAKASDWKLAGGTALVAVPLGIGIFVGGEVVLGVGTLGAAVEAGAAAGSGVASLIGSTATVAPGLGAGTYPALVVNGTVYVARFHTIAWQMAGYGTETFYGMATINAAGQVIKLFK